MQSSLAIGLSETCSQTRWFGTYQFPVWVLPLRKLLWLPDQKKKPPRCHRFDVLLFLRKYLVDLGRSEQQGGFAFLSFDSKLLWRYCPFNFLCVRIRVQARAIIFLTKLQCGHPIHLVLVSIKSWLIQMLLYKSFDPASRRLIAFNHFYLRPLIILCWLSLKVFDKIQSVFLCHFYLHIKNLRKELF